MVQAPPMILGAWFVGSRFTARRTSIPVDIWKIEITLIQNYYIVIVLGDHNDIIFMYATAHMCVLCRARRRDFDSIIRIRLPCPAGCDFQHSRRAIKKTKDTALRLRLRATKSYNFFLVSLRGHAVLSNDLRNPNTICKFLYWTKIRAYRHLQCKWL